MRHFNFFFNQPYTCTCMSNDMHIHTYKRSASFRFFFSLSVVLLDIVGHRVLLGREEGFGLSNMKICCKSKKEKKKQKTENRTGAKNKCSLWHLKFMKTLYKSNSGP